MRAAPASCELVLVLELGSVTPNWVAHPPHPVGYNAPSASIITFSTINALTKGPVPLAAAMRQSWLNEVSEKERQN
jgi:hypothetical protein